jgi:maltose alpha-D-glucosyltransferase / alpha-amylase
MKPSGSATDPLWYKDAIIYEVAVKSFFDSNQDGVGDFAGLTQKLDYLQDLGVTCLWLLPFFPSPLRDDGYDISDYRNVHPAYGTLDDFRAFLDQAHRRNMQVMIEMVVNHTSDQHPWFQAARQAPPGSPERNFYVWSDDDRKFGGARIIFVDTEKSNWTWDPVAKAYYWHRFFSHQPDLNFDNPEVLREVLEAMRFWLDQGVDAMRLDAIPYLVERENTTCENLPETHEVIRKIRAALDERYANRMMLAEANQQPAQVLAYFGKEDECQLAFHFPLMPRLFMGLRLEDRQPIVDVMAETPEIPPSCQWGLFLRNHDELTLEMVSDRERDYMYLAYSMDPRMRVNVGIRRRLAPLMENNRRRIELLNSILLSFPGTPIIYYGDEIGMGDNIYLGDRNGVRTPMQWSGDRNGGFSRAAPERLYSPVVLDPVFGYPSINVEAQLSDSSSMLHWMRNMLGLRKLFKVFGRGGIEFLRPANRKILAYLRTWEKEQILCVANLSRFAQPVELDLARFEGMVPVEMMGYVEFPPIRSAPYPLTLGPYSSLWFELQTRTAPVLRDVDGEPGEPVLASASLREAMDFSTADGFERILSTFITRQRWWTPQSRTMEGVTVSDLAEIPGMNAAILIAEVRFAQGEPESYFIPLVNVPADRMRGLREQNPEAFFAACQGGQGAFFDATVDEAFSQWLLGVIEAGRSVSLDKARLQGMSGPLLPLLHPNQSELLPPTRYAAEKSSSSIRFGERLMLKLFRRPTCGPHPECEMIRYLSEECGFAHVPKLAGTLDFVDGGGAVRTVGMLAELVENQGDLWTWSMEELRRFFEDHTVGSAPAAVIETLGRSALALSEQPLPEIASLHLGLYLEAAAIMGRRTAEMHLALARDTQDPAFRPQPLSPAELAGLAHQGLAHALKVLTALKARLATLPDDQVELVGLLLANRRRVFEFFQRLEEIHVELQKIRVHGNLDLGQILRRRNDFVIVGFKGDAGTPEERRLMQSPLKDVAGVLRSLRYASTAALTLHLTRRPQDAETLEPWARFWSCFASASFLASYRTVAAGAAFLPADTDTLGRVLDAFLVDKALADFSHELENRPAGARIPLLALLALVREPLGER